MEKSIQHLIEKYIDGELTPEEIAKLEKLIQTDAEYQKAWQNSLMTDRVIEFAIGNSLRTTMKTWSAEQSSNMFIKVAWRRVAAVAASVLLAFGLAHFYASQHYSNEALLASTASFLSENTRGASGNFEPNSTVAAIKLIETNPAAAKAKLTELHQQETLPEKKQILEWNLMRAELAMNRIDSVEGMLNNILADPSHSYHKQALKLQAQLRSFWRKI